MTVARALERPAIVGAAGALTIAFSAILVRLAEVTPETAAVFRCLYAVPLLAVLARREDRRHGPREPGERRLAVAAGVLFALDLIFWHHAIANVGAGLATVLGNLQVVVVPLVGWLVLTERPAAPVVAAVPLALTGALLISGTLERGAYGADPALGVLYGVLTSLAYAGFLLVLRHANADRERPAGPLFDATAAAAVAALAIGLVLGRVDLLPGWPAQGWLIALALSSQVMGWMLISLSLARLQAAVASVLLLLQPVGSVLLAVALLGEDPSELQLGGVAVVLGAIGLVALSRRRAPVPLEPAT